MECPICHGKGKRVNLEKCTSCGHVYCWSCDGQSGMGGTSCPECNGNGTMYREGIASPDGDGNPEPDW